MFYNYLGFYGENLKVAKLEQFIAKKGKTEEFHRVFEKKNGASWFQSRDAFAFFEDDVVETLQQVLGMSFQKDALLDNLIRRGGREGQSRLKTRLNTGKLILAGFDNFVNGFLTGADDPYPSISRDTTVRASLHGTSPLCHISSS